MSSEDPWFRPVDLQLGSDGALYVADFYNRIIGHYEVPLTHPGRDRERGRIWRIVYRGTEQTRAEPRSAGVSPALDARGLINELASANITRRMLAMHALVDNIGKAAIQSLQKALARPVNPFQKAHVLWALQRLEALDQKALASAAKDSDRLVRVHASFERLIQLAS